MEVRLGPKFECATHRGQRLHSRDPQEKELTSDNIQEGLLLPRQDASRWKVSTPSIQGPGAHSLRLPDFAGKASRETRGSGQGKYSAPGGWRRRRLLTWGPRSKPGSGARRACGGGGREPVSARALGPRRSPRPSPGRRFLARARPVTAIQRVCVRFAAVTS